MKKIITRQERNILINSDVTQKHPVLINLIKDRIDLSRAELDALSSNEQDFIQNKLYDVINDAISEWELEIGGIEYTITKVSFCKLCNRRMSSVLRIRNKYNNKILTIGQSCIKQFNFGMDKEINIILDKKKIEAREKYMHQTFPKVEEVIIELNDILDGNKFDCNDELTIVLMNKDIEIQRALEIYLDPKTSAKLANEIIIKIGIFMDNRQDVLSQIGSKLEEINHNKSA